MRWKDAWTNLITSHRKCIASSYLSYTVQFINFLTENKKSHLNSLLTISHSLLNLILSMQKIRGELARKKEFGEFRSSNYCMQVNHWTKAILIKRRWPEKSSKIHIIENKGVKVLNNTKNLLVQNNYISTPKLKNKIMYSKF